MLTDVLLVALWVAAMTYAIWHCATADRRHDKAAERRLRAELARHNTELWQHEDPT